MNNRIYLSAPDIGPEEENAVLRAMQSGWVSPLGPEVDAFEKEIASFVGAKYGVALSSGTSALHLGLLALGVSPGDIVITSTLTFVATANAILYTGAKPYFIDSEFETGNISPVLLVQAIKHIQSQKLNIGAIVPVDLLGKTIKYNEIAQIAEKYDIPLLCDAAESLGASFQGKSAGSWGNASIVSFNGNKIMTTSGGGMLLTNDESVAHKVRFLATQAREPVLHYEHIEMGFNYRLSNVLAALGRAQLSRLPEMIARRRQIREKYRHYFSSLGGAYVFGGNSDSEDNCWLTSVIIDSEITQWTPNALIDHLSSFNIETRPLWKPMHLQPLFSASEGIIDGTAESIFNQGITLPSGSGLTDDEVDYVLEKIDSFINSRK